MPRLDRPPLPGRALRLFSDTTTPWATALLVGLLGLCLHGPTPARAQLGGGGGLPLPTPIDVPSVEIEGLLQLDGVILTSDVMDGGTLTGASTFASCRVSRASTTATRAASSCRRTSTLGSSRASRSRKTCSSTSTSRRSTGSSRTS